MTENSANQITRSAPFVWLAMGKTAVWSVVLAIVVMACIAVLETRFWGVDVDDVSVGETPVTLYRAGTGPAPPVIVAHGFGGSRQMMDQIAVSLARQGFLVASVDLPGHGRNGQRLSPDITNLDGTTAQLVVSVQRVADAVAACSDTTGPISFVGHSMASDIVIRAAQARDDVGGVVAISMYSPAVTQTTPSKLLVLSGATETHLRTAGLDAVRQIDADATEGETVTQNGVQRRTAVAPWVGHVGVLYAPTSLDEVTRWLRGATGMGQPATLDHSGWVAGVLFVGLVMLVWPLSTLLPKSTFAAPGIPTRAFVACLLAPFPFALLIGALPTFGVAGQAAFGTLAAIFAVWGCVQLAILYRTGVRPTVPDLMSTFAYLAVAMVFALALDSYGAAFLPTGERWTVMGAMLIGTVPLMVADTMLVHGASLLRRILLRLALLVGLAGAMALAPTELGVVFTTLPVLLLYFLVYGTMARWIAARRGPSGVALGKAVVLAWAVAASTPLFAIAGAS